MWCPGSNAVTQGGKEVSPGTLPPHLPTYHTGNLVEAPFSLHQLFFPRYHLYSVKYINKYRA